MSNWTMDRIRARNAAAAAGSHWFNRGTLRFFHSRISATVYEGPGGVYFVSSEQFEDSRGIRAPRRYTVRAFNPATGDAAKASEFNVLTRAAAHRQAGVKAAGGFRESGRAAEEKK